MAGINTDRLAPRIVLNEDELNPTPSGKLVQPVVLSMGFSPIGRTNEMVVCNTVNEIYREFGYPTSAPEKWFVDAGVRVVQNGGTALMTRLPYDNFQCHSVRYVDYRLDDPIAWRDIATGPAETQTRLRDDSGVTVLKEMNAVDSRMNQFQRIVQKPTPQGDDVHIGSMTNEELQELELDEATVLESGTFRIVDVVGRQYSVGSGKREYAGIFPILTTSPMALYYQGKIQNTTDLDDCLRLVDLEDGVEMATDWYRNSSRVSDSYKAEQARIVAAIQQQVNFDTSTNRFHRSESFQDSCCSRFPQIPWESRGRLTRTSIDHVGLLVCQLKWDDDLQVNQLEVLEAFEGTLRNGRQGLKRQINARSRYVRMYQNLEVPTATDFFVVDSQRLTVLGTTAQENDKYINYKTSIMDPVRHVLDSVYSDVDSVWLDVILDAGLSSTAFAAYVARTQNGETYAENQGVRTKVDWSRNSYPLDENVEKAAEVWAELTKMMADFCQNVRGDCVYVADGPRILNLERNYPIRNYTDLENLELFNAYLPSYNGATTSNYVARYWNWVYIEDMQTRNRGLWVPGSVVMGGQLAYNDKSGRAWYAPAGENRGIVDGAYDVSVRTRSYNSENDVLYQNNWNFFVLRQNEGVVVEGNRNLQTRKTSMDRVNVRRMICHIKQRIRQISNHYKYEPNTSSLRKGYVSELTTMLEEIRRTDGISDYQILCDGTNNTTATIDRHELHCKIGVKPIKALEYLIIDLTVQGGTIQMDDSKYIRVQS